LSKIVLLLTFITFLYGIVTFILYKYKPKFLWLLPVVATFISGCLVLKDIRLYTTSESTITRKLAFYFHNDVLMGLYLIYLPIIGIAVIMVVIAYAVYLFNYYRRKHVLKN